MNKLVFEILNIIYDYCIDGTYKIIDVNDIILGMPKNIEEDNDAADLDVEKLLNIIEDLATDGAIDLKYRDEEDICLAITTKGKRLVKKERETRIKIEEQRKAKLEEEARQKALKEAEEKARIEREEKERQERILKEKELEEAKITLEELKANKKLKKAPETQELKQKVQELEHEIIEEKEHLELTNEVDNVIPEVREDNAVIQYDIGRSKRIGNIAFFGGLSGAFIGNAIFWILKHFIGF